MVLTKSANTNCHPQLCNGLSTQLIGNFRDQATTVQNTFTEQYLACVHQFDWQLCNTAMWILGEPSYIASIFYEFMRKWCNIDAHKSRTIVNRTIIYMKYRYHVTQTIAPSRCLWFNDAWYFKLYTKLWRIHCWIPMTSSPSNWSHLL